MTMSTDEMIISLIFLNVLKKLFTMSNKWKGTDIHFDITHTIHLIYLKEIPMMIQDDSFCGG